MCSYFLVVRLLINLVFRFVVTVRQLIELSFKEIPLKRLSITILDGTIEKMIYLVKYD